MPSYAYPPPPDSVEPTSLDTIDTILERLSANKDAWVRTTYDQRLSWLEQIRTNIKQMGEGLVQDAMKAKGLTKDHPSFGEDWQTSVYVSAANVTGLIDTYKALRSTGKVPVEGLTTKVRSTGQLAVRTFPYAFLDRLTLTGYEGWVIMQQGVTAENLQDHCGQHIKHPGEGKLCHVLGAGNVASIPLQDALYKLFVENEIVVLKMNPVNDYAGKHIRKALQPLVEAGYVEVVYGGVEQGVHLCNHPLVDTMHITGSDATHDAIVWGPRDGRDERKAKGERVNDKPISSELGNVTPIIVVPGEWSKADMEYQAANIASMVTNNASFNCIAGKLLVVSEGWAQKDELIEALRRFLGTVPTRKAYYPGAQQRWQAFLDAHPDAERIGNAHEEDLPWTLITGLDPAKTDDICFTTEPFCAVLSVVELPEATPMEFMASAVKFCNDVVWGTLSSSIIIHDKQRKDPAIESALQDAVDELRYGGVAINHWAGLPYGISTMTWGAFPGHTLEDIGSGIGVVHNSLMFDKPEKSVWDGPFNPPIKPVWNVDNRRYEDLGKALTNFAESPSLLGIIPVAWNALRG